MISFNHVHVCILISIYICIYIFNSIYTWSTHIMFAVPGLKLPRVFVPEVSRNDDEKSSGCWNMTEIGTLILYTISDIILISIRCVCFTLQIKGKGMFPSWPHDLTHLSNYFKNINHSSHCSFIGQQFWVNQALMEEILHQLIGSLSQYLKGFTHPRWRRISEPSTVC